MASQLKAFDLSFSPLWSKKSIAGIWVVLALVSTTTLYYQLEKDTPWLDILPVKLLVWLFWGAYAILIFRFTRWIQMQTRNPIGIVVPFLMFCVISIVIQVAFYAFIAWLIGLGAFASLGFTVVFSILFKSLFEWYFILFWAVVILTLAFDYYQKFRRQELEAVYLQTQLVQAQLNTLKMQLQPHFLFNTLNTIVSLVRQENLKTAIEMLSGLSDLLRQTLSQKDQQQVNLVSEIQFTESYLELEKKRFGERIEVSIKIDPAARLALIPTFLLQPLVENAVYHGLSKKRSAKSLKITVNKNDNRLKLMVYNDGPQLSENFVLERSSGVGLSSTVERLSQLYGNAFSLSIYNRAKGVELTIEIPFIENEA